MTWPLLFVLTVGYVLGLIWMRSKGWQLRTFVWASFGQAYLVLQFGLFINLADSLAALEARNIQSITNLLGYDVQVFEETTLLVPDQEGWVSMTIGIESSTLIEMAVCSGLILYYPGLSRRRRIASLMIGLSGTYILNLLRLFIIVFIITNWGRSSFVIAHALVGRVVYFIGVVVLYWYLLTTPTVKFVQDAITERDV